MAIVRRNEEYLSNIVKGWNKKRFKSNLDLSSLTPFVQLYVLYEGNLNQKIPITSSRIRNNEPIIDYLRRSRRDDVINITIKNSDENNRTTNFVGVEIGKLESQVKSKNTKGGVGINSLRVNRGTREAFTSKYDLDLTITDNDIIKENIELTSLYTLNQDFLIIYGWNANNNTDFNSPPSVSNGNLIVNIGGDDGSHEGNWTASLISLQKFNFALEQQSHLNAKLTFLSSRMTKVSFRRARDITKSVLREIQLPSTDSNILGELGRKELKEQVYNSIRTNQSYATGLNPIRTFGSVTIVPHIYITDTQSGSNEVNDLIKGLIQNIATGEISEEIVQQKLSGQSFSQTSGFLVRNEKYQEIRREFIDNEDIKLETFNYYYDNNPQNNNVIERHKENREEFIDSYITKFYSNDTAVNGDVPMVISFSNYRDTLTLYTDVNDTKYGIGLLNKLQSSNSDFKRINPKFNDTYSLPKSSVIPIKMTYKVIRRKQVPVDTPV